MIALDILAAEHRAIERELEILIEIAGEFERRAPVPLDTVDAVLDFLQQVADGVHHKKEEQELFPLLTERGGMPDPSVLRSLLDQHDAGRTHVQQMRDSLNRLRGGQRAGAIDFSTTARIYADLLRHHIRIEDDYLYPIAAKVLTPEDDRRLCAAFSGVGRLRGH